eukprot:COSAG03_NODE_5443_length_1248_cov_1.165361_2_plen_100_part_00
MGVNYTHTHTHTHTHRERERERETHPDTEREKERERERERERDRERESDLHVLKESRVRCLRRLNLRAVSECCEPKGCIPHHFGLEQLKVVGHVLRSSI